MVRRLEKIRLEVEVALGEIGTHWTVEVSREQGSGWTMAEPHDDARVIGIGLSNRRVGAIKKTHDIERGCSAVRQRDIDQPVTRFGREIRYVLLTQQPEHRLDVLAVKPPGHFRIRHGGVWGGHIACNPANFGT